MRFLPLAPWALIPAVLPLAAYDPASDLEAGRFLKAQAEAEARLRQNPLDALARAARSQALTAQQRFFEALSEADRAVALAPPSGPVRAQALLARGLARAGSALRERNFSSLRKAGGALDDLDQATRQDPTLTRAWISLGLAYQELPGILGGSTYKALRCAGQLKAVNQARGDLLYGLILSLDERWKEAEPCFRNALAAAPGDVEVLAFYLEALGSREARKALGPEEQRRRLAAEARRLQPRFPTQARALEALSDALLKAGQPEEAWTFTRTALDRADAPSLLRLQLGKVAARSGLHRDEGLAQLDRVLKEPLEGGSGGYPAAHWRRAQILQALGRLPEARAAAQEALKLDPKHPGAKKVLEALD